MTIFKLENVGMKVRNKRTGEVMLYKSFISSNDVTLQDLEKKRRIETTKADSNYAQEWEEFKELQEVN